MTTILGLGIIWTGYLFIWYGVTTKDAPGVGLLDLADPRRAGQLVQAINRQQQLKQQTGSGTPSLSGAGQLAPGANPPSVTIPGGTVTA